VKLEPLAALTAALAITAGAFGAHGLGAPFADWAKTGAFYALTHALACLLLTGEHPRAARLMLLGATIFSASLYAMALGGPRWLGAVTPLGGILMIAAWLCIAWSSWRAPQIKP
jgi:uncharacterized membrane protein YgdD (TMEM256/DUF423 family)